MTWGLLFWLLMIVWLFVGPWRSWPDRYLTSSNLLLWVLFAIIGWHLWPIHG